MNDETRRRILARRSLFVAATLVTTAGAIAVACEKTYACLEPAFDTPPTPTPAASEVSVDASAPPSLDSPAVCLSPVR
jgi:hypothetical protein